MTWYADAYKKTDPVSDDLGLVVRPIIGIGGTPLPVTVVSGTLQVSLSGGIQISASADPTRPATSNVFAVTSSVSAQVLLGANANRLGASFFNNGTELFYLKEGSGVDVSSSFTTIVWPKALYELPYPPYQGPITAVWLTGSGPVLVTERTP
jgi:hypothetical protein